MATIGPKELAIFSARLGDNIIMEDKQASASVDKQGRGDWDFLFGSQKTSNEMSVDFGRNVDEKFAMIPSIAIVSPHPQVSRTRTRNCEIFHWVRRVSPWHGTMKKEIENLVENIKDNKIKKILNAKIISILKNWAQTLCKS